MSKSISEIVTEHLNESKLTLRAFAEKLTEGLSTDGLTHATIINWRDGNTEPETDFLMRCVAAYSDWRLDFALACLQVKLPEVFDV